MNIDVLVAAVDLVGAHHDPVTVDGIGLSGGHRLIHSSHCALALYRCVQDLHEKYHNADELNHSENVYYRQHFI